MGTFTVMNRTHALWRWHRNQDKASQVGALVPARERIDYQPSDINAYLLAYDTSRLILQVADEFWLQRSPKCSTSVAEGSPLPQVRISRM